MNFGVKLGPVLLVDDNADLRGLMALALVGEGFDVLEADNGQSALELVNLYKPVLILLDLMMPVMTGWEFLRRLRSDRKNAEIPIVVCSAARNQDLAGVLFLPKPMNLDDLVRTVERHCH